MRLLFSVFNKTLLNKVEMPKKLHLLDDSELEDSRLSDANCADLPSPSNDLPSQSTAENCTLLTRWAKQCCCSWRNWLLPCCRMAEDTISSANQFCTMQGCVRRKTVLKEGRKPTVASWQRYWVQIWASSLAYFSPKSFKGYDSSHLKACLQFVRFSNQRSDFRSEPCKLVSLSGCAIMLTDEAVHSDVFQIVDHRQSTSEWMWMWMLLWNVCCRERLQVQGGKQAHSGTMVPQLAEGGERRRHTTT